MIALSGFPFTHWCQPSRSTAAGPLQWRLGGVAGAGEQQPVPEGLAQFPMGQPAAVAVAPARHDDRAGQDGRPSDLAQRTASRKAAGVSGSQLANSSSASGAMW
ncbi:MAG: hypothetical protein U0797_15170 [Gemmataceae bacterium]